MGKDPSFLIRRMTDVYILIEDIGPWDVHQSVTNNPEAVIASLSHLLSTRSALYYIDSDGHTDELKYRFMRGRYKFSGFAKGAPLMELDRPVARTATPLASPRDDNAFWNRFVKTNPGWTGD